MISYPLYTKRHEGPVVICGSATCLMDDYRRARRSYSAAPVIAVGGSVRAVKAKFIFTQHPRDMPRWKKIQSDRFDGDFTTHSAGKRNYLTKLGKKLDDYCVDYWWDGVASGGTSAWGARRLAYALGFDQVILCGCPLEVGPYFYKGISKPNNDEETMLHYREQILSDSEMHENVYSMSGWTREIFGEPNGCS